MSDENLNGNSDNDMQDQPHHPRVPLQPDIGLGLERSNNETRRNHNIEPNPGSVSFSHFLGRPPGASSAGLPDFVQDHLADIPFNLNQSRSSCDNANPTLPDFLSDTQRNVNPPEPSSSLSSSSNNVLQIENNTLRRELENVTRLLEQQRSMNSRLQNQIQEQICTTSSSHSVLISHSQTLAALQSEIETLRAENRQLKRTGAGGGSSTSNVRSSRLTQELRSQATQAEILLRTLTRSVTSIKDLAEQLSSRSSSNTQETRDYREVPSDSEED